MRKAVVLIAVAMCFLVTGVQSGWFSSYKQVNFDGLDKWLMRNLAADDELDENVNFIKNNLNQLTDDKVRRAAEVVVGLVEATDCNDQLMGYLKQVVFDKFLLKGRLERITAPALKRLTDLCGGFVDDKVAGVYASSLASQEFDRFLQVVAMSPNTWKLPVGSELSLAPNEAFCWYTGNVQQDFWDPKPIKWASHLYDLAREDDQAAVNTYTVVPYTRGKEYMTTKDHGAFVYAHNKYLAAPCKQLRAALGDTFDGMRGLLALSCSTDKSCYEQFVSKRSNTVLPLLFAHKVCKALPGVGYHESTEMFDKYSEHERIMGALLGLKSRLVRRREQLRAL